MNYTYWPSTSPSFIGNGLIGYEFGPLKQRDLAIDQGEVERDTIPCMISNKITADLLHYFRNRLFHDK
jgi:hypothetical protein